MFWPTTHILDAHIFMRLIPEKKGLNNFSKGKSLSKKPFLRLFKLFLVLASATLTTQSPRANFFVSRFVCDFWKLFSLLQDSFSLLFPARIIRRNHWIIRSSWARIRSLCLVVLGYVQLCTSMKVQNFLVFVFPCTARVGQSVTSVGCAELVYYLSASRERNARENFCRNLAEMFFIRTDVTLLTNSTRPSLSTEKTFVIFPLIFDISPSSLFFFHLTRCWTMNYPDEPDRGRHQSPF